MNFIKRNSGLLLIFLAISITIVGLELSFYGGDKPVISFALVFTSAFILVQLIIFYKLTKRIKNSTEEINKKLNDLSKTSKKQENINHNFMLAIEEIINLQKDK